MNRAIRNVGFGICVLASIAAAQRDLAQLKQDAERGDTLAICQVGDRYRSGFDTRQDYAEALRWYQRGAKEDSSCAKLGLGLMLLQGEGVARNEAEALRWLLEAAEGGIATAQLLIARS